MKHINIKENDLAKIVICLLAILLIFVLISNSYFNAKYKSKINSHDKVSIAKWNVSTNITNNTNNNLSIISENNKRSYVVTVNSQSEVATTYSIILSNVPTGLEVKIDNKDYKTPDNNIIKFDNIGSFTPSNETATHNHTLTFNDPLTTNNIGDSVIKIDVIFEQID